MNKKSLKVVLLIVSLGVVGVAFLMLLKPQRNSVETPVMPQESIVRGGVSDIVDEESSSSIAKQTIAKVNALPDDLTFAERQSLYDFLRHGENNSYNYAVKNDIMNRLRQQSTPPAELTDVLIELVQDENQDKVVRIYALQHLRPWYRMQNQKDHRIKELFMKTMQDADSELSGAALLAVRYLAKDQAEFQSPEIAKQAWKIAIDSTANELSRISAIQVASMLDSSKGDGNKYVTLAKSGNSMPIRLSAIAALGNSGDQTQRELLIQIAESENEPLKTAAKHALQKLNNLGKNKK